MADIIVHFQGSVVGFTPRTAEGRDWIDENVQSEDWQWMGRTLWIDHRFAEDLTDGMADAGLELRS